MPWWQGPTYHGQQSSSHLKILSARRETRNTFHTEGPQIFSATVQNVSPMASSCLRFVQPWYILLPICLPYDDIKEAAVGAVCICKRRNRWLHFILVFLKLQISYVEIKCQLDATEVFIADLIACSKCFGHHHAHHQHPANRTHNPQLHTRPATWKTTAQNTTRSNHCKILLGSWWWAWWCPKHVEQAIRSAI